MDEGVNPHTGIRTQIHFEGDQVVVKRPTTLNPILQRVAEMRARNEGKRWGEGKEVGVLPPWVSHQISMIGDDAARTRGTKLFFARTRRFSHTTHFSNELGPNKGRCGGVHPQDRFGRDDADILALAEQRIYYGESNSPKVRCAAMRKSASMANGTRPAGFLEAIKIAESGSPDRPLEYRPLDKMPHERRAFSWDGATLVLSDDQAFPVDLTYYVKGSPRQRWTRTRTGSWPTHLRSISHRCWSRCIVGPQTTPAPRVRRPTTPAR